MSMVRQPVAWIATGALLAAAPARGEEPKVYCDSVASLIIGNPVRLATGPYQVKLKECVSQEGQPARALAVDYDWTGTGARHAEVTHGDGYFLVTFADGPPAHVQGEVDLKFEFEPTTEDKQNARKATADLYFEIGHAAAEAMKGGTSFEGAVREAIEASLESKSAAVLSHMKVQGGATALDSALGQIGVVRTDGELAIDRATVASKLQEIVEALRAADLAADPEDVPVEDLSGDCQADVEAWKSTPIASTLLTALKSCTAAVIQRSPAAQHPNCATALGDVRSASDLSGLSRDISAVEDVCAPGPEARAVASLATFVEVTRAREATEALVQVERTVHVVSASKELAASFRGTYQRRYYNVSTGVVHAFALEDWVVPLFVSFCPGQCLSDDAPGAFEGTFWTLKNLASSVSIDFGIRTAVIDDQTDPRDGGNTAFLLGASWNLVNVARLAGGAYLFENPLTDDWEADGYLGLTVDLVRAAELLGVIGFGTPVPPQWGGGSPKEGEK